MRRVIYLRVRELIQLSGIIAMVLMFIKSKDLPPFLLMQLNEVLESGAGNYIFLE
jgi:hypothetical protein